MQGEEGLAVTKAEETREVSGSQRAGRFWKGEVSIVSITKVTRDGLKTLPTFSGQRSLINFAKAENSRVWGRDAVSQRSGVKT